MDRRVFLGYSALTALQFAAMGMRPAQAANSAKLPLAPAGALLDLPEGFRYRVLQRAGQPTADGYVVPLQPDGMACFGTTKNTWTLLRNHELGREGYMERLGLRTAWTRPGQPPPQPSYRPEQWGGVARVLLDPQTLQQELSEGRPDELSRAITHTNMALAGTARNCAGGVLPGGWVTCEETDEPEHGWAFFVSAEDDALQTPRRIDSWGRMFREGVALDPSTGVVYMTEDHVKGCLYRHVPAQPKAPMGPGTLEVLCLEKPTYTAQDVTDGQTWAATWRPIPDPAATKTRCRDQGAALGAALFSRGEGIDWSNGNVWVVCTTGGPINAGQIFRYTVADSTLTLIKQVTDRATLSMPDNGIVTPWGDLLLAEDNYNAADGCTHQHLRLLTRDGTVIDVARNRRNSVPGKNAPGGEFTGPCFGPDGRTLFVNLQSPENVTVAIEGPWHDLS